MVYKANLVITFHTRFKDKSTFNCDALTSWMLENYDILDNFGNDKMSITINKSSFGIHRHSQFLHGHIALETELKTYKKNYKDYVDIKAFKNMIKRNLDLTKNPFDVPLSLTTPHITIKFAELSEDTTELHDFHLAYVLKEYETFDAVELLQHFKGLTNTEIEDLRIFANDKYKQTIKKKQYDEKYNNKNVCEFEELTNQILLSSLPSENSPVSVYDEVLYQLTEHLCLQDIPDFKKSQKIAKLPNLAYIYSLKYIKNKKNKQKLIRHINRYHIPREETQRQDFKNYATEFITLDINSISDKELKKLNKLTSK